jgi:RimJ/RimL family protein N-acetyltransferase
VFELRDVASEDFAALVGMMRDPASATMAAFGSRDDDAAAMEERWRRGSGRGHRKAIVVDAAVAGFVATFEQDGVTHVTYWIARSLWGRGLATSALMRLLDFVAVRPLHASTWSGNVGSQRVLEKCGFVRTHEARAFAGARGEEVTEVFFALC